MEFRTRKLVRQEDLNPMGNLFGGRVLQWIDEEAAIFAMCQLSTKNVVTKVISEINFVAPGHLGDIIQIGMSVKSFGRTSITCECLVRNKDTQKEIIKIDKIVFVSVDKDGVPVPHGVQDRVKKLAPKYQCSGCGVLDGTVNRDLFDGMCPTCTDQALDDPEFAKACSSRNDQLKSANR